MAEPTIRPIREADVKQIHEIEKACFAMPWSEESILHDVKENVVLSARNIPGVETSMANLINVYDILKAKYLVLDKEALAVIEEVFA